MLLVELSPFNKSRLPVYVAYTFSRVPELAVAVPPPAVDGPAVRAGRGVPQTCRGVDNTQPPEAADQRRLRDRRPGGGAALPVLVGAPAQQPAARRDGHRVARPRGHVRHRLPRGPGRCAARGAARGGARARHKGRPQRPRQAAGAHLPVHVASPGPNAAVDRQSQAVAIPCRDQLDAYRLQAASRSQRDCASSE
eukprot:CAMPEP_0177589832 /NCGR_PEP_ID=MMETSP0419_2-20121207/7043_1 /TAXON_ID=582737 /ORGANISM="Tetraselmis sp., Strain GSL018" /LENGTH=194 /DNA_ID=CAMNT_0019080271 /DNA_START=1948 /DNA_END=2532 /DNA_ORIENTATION=-